MSDQFTSIFQQKRLELHKLIDSLPVDLELVERLLARFEMDRLWKEVGDGFTQDWANGKYSHLDEIIREVGADLGRQHNHAEQFTTAHG